MLNDLKQSIEAALDAGSNNFIIVPFGEIGQKVKMLLNTSYGIREKMILDNHLCKYNKDIKPLQYLDRIKISGYTIILACINDSIYDDLRNELLRYVEESQLIEFSFKKSKTKAWETKIGKYSYGPICVAHELIESIGAFCSFATGVEVVPNHEMRYILTHPMLFADYLREDIGLSYRDYINEPWYFEREMAPRDKLERRKKSRIGNDVWLGRNVIITNSANIGNGVIAGAGAVITKDIPDYAVVVGVPARIIYYRYNEAQIEALNRIKWWDWTDEEIRERFEDFYIHIDEFIKKYDK